MSKPKDEAEKRRLLDEGWQWCEACGHMFWFVGVHPCPVKAERRREEARRIRGAIGSAGHF